jgi:pimeloyl-ACP methyl ester carboxylesterase
MDKYITVKGVKIRYNFDGIGPAMIMMHGWGCKASTLAILENVAVEQHTVYNLDLPGFGESEEPTEVWGIEEYTEMLEDFVKQLGIEKPILLGHSFGGRISILYASRNDVDKVVLVDAAGVKPKRTVKYYYKVYSFKMAKRLAYIFLNKDKAEKVINKWRGKAGSSDYSQASAKMRAIMSRIVNQDLCKFMPKIKAPTLLIWGENDKATPISDAKKMEKLIPDAGLVSFPGAGHYSFIDNPYQSCAVLRSFINK